MKSMVAGPNALDNSDMRGSNNDYAITLVEIKSDMQAPSSDAEDTHQIEKVTTQEFKKLWREQQKMQEEQYALELKKRPVGF